MDGVICNTGHSVVFYLENGTKNHINITGGPLSYKYQVYEIHVHYGQQDEMGSEHSINGYAFPAEVSPRARRVLLLYYAYGGQMRLFYEWTVLVFGGMSCSCPGHKCRVHRSVLVLNDLPDR